MSPQLQQRELYFPLIVDMRTIFSSRWTDDAFICILSHTNGDFATAVNTILRHEATGQPPEVLIRLLSGGGRGWHFNSSSPHRWRRHSYSENSPHSLQSVGLGGGGGLNRNRSEGDSEPVALNRNRSEGAAVTSYDFVPPLSNLSIEGEGAEPHLLSERCTDVPQGEEQVNNGPSSAGERKAFVEDAFDMSSEDLQTRVHRCPSSKNGPPISSSTAQVNNTTQTEQGEPLNQNLRPRHLDGEPDLSELEPKHQQMLDMQSGIEASLRETKNASETDPDTDDEALSYAVKVSKETFDEEYRNQQLRNALEERMIKISLAASLSDPVKKSEEELIGEALKISLADPVHKSEEQLIEEARENSLEDIERVETIIKSEKELVEIATQKSLHTMSKEEELIEAVKRQSLKDARNDPLWRALEESRSESLEMDNQRRLTSSTHLLSCGDGGNSECSSCVEHLPPSRFDSPLKGSDLHLSDRKMPALVLPAAQQNCEEDQAQDDNRSRAMSDCSSSVEHHPPSRSDSTLTSSDLLDRKMPALVLPASPNGDVMSNPEVASNLLSLAGHAREYGKRSGANENLALEGSGEREVRCLSVEGASLSLINGVYEEEVNESKMFTLRVLGLNGGITTVARIYQTSTQGRKEWVFSISSSNFSPSSASKMDIILYTASVDIDDSNFIVDDDLPSPSTNWVGRNAMVMGGSPPKVTVV